MYPTGQTGNKLWKRGRVVESVLEFNKILFVICNGFDLTSIKGHYVDHIRC